MLAKAIHKGRSTRAWSLPIVIVKARGNVLVSFLHDMAVEKLRRDELEERDPAYEAVVKVRLLEAGTNP